MTSAREPVPPPGAVEPDRRRLRRLFYLLTITVAAGVLSASLLNVEPLLSANDRSRWSTVWSLVERGTYRIDEIDRRPGWRTIDKVRHEGHFYSSKPPLLPTLVAGVYWSVKKVTGWNLLDNTDETARLILVVVNLIPMIAALVVIALIAERYAQTDAARIYIVVAAAFATFLTTFTVTLNNHTVAAVSVVFALYPAMRIVADGIRQPIYFAMAGFFAAFACTNELPAALFGLALFGLLFFQAPRPTLMFFVPAALVPLGAYFWTTYLATGGWKPFYMYYGTEKYEYVHEGVPSYWMNPRGIDRSLDSPLVYFLHCTVGHHGIFSLSPVFLLTAAAWVGIRKWQRFPLRVFLWMGLLLTVAVLGFYLTRTENYNYGGNSAGLRWVIWLVPFWLVAMIPVLDTWGDRRWFRLTAAGLLFISVFSAAAPLDNPWRQPWLFTWMERQGWLDHYRDEPPRLPRPLTTWFASLPAGPSDEPEWVEFVSLDAGGTPTRLRLSDAGPDEYNGRRLRKIEVERLREQEAGQSVVYAIDVDLFEAGLPPSEFLHWPAGAPDPAEQAEAHAFLSGLPRTAPYRAGRIRYLRTHLRRDAFECQQAAARVRFQPTGSDRSFWFRRDVWLSREVPFGVVQFEITISDPQTNAVLTTRRYAISAVSGFK